MNEMYENCMKVAADKVQSYRDFWWGAPDAMNKGTPPPPPSPREQAAAGEEMMISDLRTLPARKIIQAASKAGEKVDVQVGDERVSADFEGYGDLDQLKTDLAVMRESADALAAMNLDIQQRYGSDMNLEVLKRIREADPEGWELRQRLAAINLEELAAGRNLGEAASRQVEQSVRGAQAARGNVYGAANIGQEALAKFDMGQRLLTQRMSNAQAYALGTPITAQYGSISGAQQGAAAFTPMQAQPGIGLDQNAMARGQQGLMQGYSTYVSGLQNQSNPWMEGLGIVAGVGAQAAGGYYGGLGYGLGQKAAKG